MKARLFNLGGEHHHAIERMLPWYANGTLEEAERAEVEAHLHECARCRGDLAWQQRFTAAAAQADAEPIRDDHADEGWARLRQAVTAAPSATPWALRRAPPRRLAWAFVAAPLALAGVIGAGLIARDGAPYRGLAATAPSPANALVVFAPGTTEAQIRALLRAQQAQVVSGPTSTDAWLVQVPHDRLPGAISAWRAQGAVARAESLEAAPQPSPEPAR